MVQFDAWCVCCLGYDDPWLVVRSCESEKIRAICVLRKFAVSVLPSACPECGGYVQKPFSELVDYSVRTLKQRTSGA